MLIAGAALVALMLLFPPWDHFDRDSSGRQSAGYHFFLTPPQPKPAQEIFGNARFPHMTSIRLNDVRLILQLFITIPGWLGLLFLRESRRTKSVLSWGLFFSWFPFSSWLARFGSLLMRI
jgi:hypothetical protein